MNPLDRPDRDLLKGHLLLQERWPKLLRRLTQDGFAMMLIEVYRPDTRQQWLYAQGRTPEACAIKGIPTQWARPGSIVTNAWSAKTSAHGWTSEGEPAAAALDVVPVGADGKPWTIDDPWDAFVSAIARYGAEVGLVHFTSRGKVTDRPHLQLREYSDLTHRLEL